MVKAIPRRRPAGAGRRRLALASDGPAAKAVASPPPAASRRPRVAVLVAARPALFREILAFQLDSQPGLHVVGHARDEDQIREIMKREKPGVLLLDYEGLCAGSESMIARLRRAGPVTRILVLAARSTEEVVERVLRVGAAGLADKQLEFATLVRAIQAVAAGELWANRRTAAQALEHMMNPSASMPLHNRLTDREQEITDGVGRGLRNKEIARRLNISEKTVKSHLNNIFRKLQVDNRFAVGLYALDIKPKN